MWAGRAGCLELVGLGLAPVAMRCIVSRFQGRGTHNGAQADTGLRTTYKKTLFLKGFFAGFWYLSGVAGAGGE